MDLTPHVESLQEQLAAAGAAGDEQTQRTALLLAAALEPAIRLALLSALAELAVDVTDALGDRIVEVRLARGDVHVVVTALSESDAVAVLPEDEAPSPQAGEPARITLRIAESVKADAERAASAGGLSLNGWLAHVVREALRGDRSATTSQQRPGQRTHRVRGWVEG